MSKRKIYESFSADAKKKRCLDTSGRSSSVDTESGHFFPDKESTNSSTEAISFNPTLDTEYLDIIDTLTLARRDRENQGWCVFPLVTIGPDLDILDTLTLARRDRENQGPWEAEYSYGGEADLHRHYNICAKNPGHKDFIPVERFSIEDLPEGYRHKDIMDFIRAESDLTVRVTVKYVSDRRPATDPGSNQPYPGHGNRGQKRVTVGTGWVDNAYVYGDRQGETCTCKYCRISPTPETKFAVIRITTAKHVVFDDLEAEHTTCHLFFDSGCAPDTCSGVVTLTGMQSIYSNIETDQHYMMHFTHDLDLGNRLRKMCTRKDDLLNKLSKTLPRITKYKRSLNAAEKQPLSFIVSHPHGCRKHISIGHWTSISRADIQGFACEYTTATCPGSSGAKVVMPHQFSQDSITFELILLPGTHCGTSEERPGVNYFKRLYFLVSTSNPTALGRADTLETTDKMLRLSDSAYDRLRRDVGSGRVYLILAGPGEDKFRCVDEEDLHKHDDIFQRNPGHQNFCPVDKFGIENLPPFCTVMIR